MIANRTGSYLTMSQPRPGARRAPWSPNVGALLTNDGHSEQRVLPKPLHTNTILNGYVTI